MGELALRARRESILGIAILIVATAIGCSEDTEGVPDGSVGDGSTIDDGTVPPPDGGDDAGTGSDAGDGGGNEPATYAQVAALFESRCGGTVGGCHGGVNGSAALAFEEVGSNPKVVIQDLTTVLNGVPSCENNVMPRVDPGNPENSWLMVKLGGHSTIGISSGRVDLGGTPPEDDRVACPLPMNSASYPYGEVMPIGVPLSETDVDLVRRWIQQGAPGPS